MAAPRAENLLPGVKGKDYHFVKYQGRIYVVYSVTLGNGQTLKLSWRVSEKDLETFNINPSQVRSVSAGAFKAMNVFGDVSEIQRRGDDLHPFQKFLQHLQELYGPVSWIQDKQFVGIMLMGWAEGWSDIELQQRLTRTRWYKTRTQFEREWELTGKADRNASTKLWTSRIEDALEELYGEVGHSFSSEQVAEWAEKIASGVLGMPEEGFEIWFGRRQTEAEKMEGTPAWMAGEQELEAQRAFLNRPEDMLEQIKQQALFWLGPRGVPDDATLQRWATDLVSQVKSDADWQQFLQNQAQALYPWLGPNEGWQDRAASYKQIVESTWGSPIGWDHEILSHLGQADANGGFTGSAMPFDEFEKLVRSKPEFWHGPVARQEGVDLVRYFNEIFRGVS